MPNGEQRGKEMHNSGVLPSLNQISLGLILEAVQQVKDSMYNVENQNLVLEAQENVKKTWEEMLSKADDVE